MANLAITGIADLYWKSVISGGYDMASDTMTSQSGDITRLLQSIPLEFLQRHHRGMTSQGSSREYSCGFFCDIKKAMTSQGSPRDIKNPPRTRKPVSI
ncbi:unnamed protein product [Lota lota]